MSPTYIHDVIYVNTVERRLGRKLSPKDINEFGDFEVSFPDGHKEYFIIPSLVFPYDLLSAPELGVVNTIESEDESDEEAPDETEDLQYPNAS